jgi:hypothetical protein
MVKRKKRFKYFGLFLDRVTEGNGLRNSTRVFLWFLSYTSQKFSYRAQRLPKFLRRRLGRRYSLSPVLITRARRLRAGLRALSFHIEEGRNRSLRSRAYLALEDVALNYKLSRLFKQKVRLYRRVLGTIRGGRSPF